MEKSDDKSGLVPSRKIPLPDTGSAKPKMYRLSWNKHLKNGIKLSNRYGNCSNWLHRLSTPPPRDSIFNRHSQVIDNIFPSNSMYLENVPSGQIIACQKSVSRDRNTSMAETESQ